MRVILLRLLFVIGVATAVAWAVSFPKPFIWLTSLGENACLEVTVFDGDCAILFLDNPYGAAQKGFQLLVEYRHRGRELNLEYGFKPGVATSSGAWPALPRIRGYEFPLWLLSGSALAYPVFMFIRAPLRRRRRDRDGLCLSCGYNLTGNTSGVCPECAAKVGGVRATHPRARRILKWGGSVACGVIVVVMAASQGWWSFRVGAWTISVQRGGVTIDWITIAQGPNAVTQIPSFVPRQASDADGKITNTAPSSWWLHFSAQNQDFAGALHIPFWALLIAIGIPTVWLWRHDRRHAPEHGPKCATEVEA